MTSADGYFGLCPHCKNTDGYMNDHQDHWFICDEHRVAWNAGSNLFSSWQDEDEAAWAVTREKIANYEIVEPFYPAREGKNLGTVIAEAATLFGAERDIAARGFPPPDIDDLDRLLGVAQELVSVLDQAIVKKVQASNLRATNVRPGAVNDWAVDAPRLRDEFNAMLDRGR